MNDFDWELLVELYEKKSISKTAEVLNITQSALTKRIKKIETEWNTEVIMRSSKGVAFTENGKYLVKRACVVLDIVDEIKRHFNEGSIEKEILKIGVPNSFARLHFPKFLNSYVENFDELQFSIVPNSSDTILKKLTEGSIDIGIICGDFPFIGEKILLFDEDLHVAVPKGVGIDDLEKLPLIESYLNPIVKSIVEQWWKLFFGSMPHTVHRVPYSDISIEMVESNLGISFIFGTGWRYNIDKIDMIAILDDDGKPISRSVYMMVSDRCFNSPEIKNFVTFAKKYYEIRS